MKYLKDILALAIVGLVSVFVFGPSSSWDAAEWIIFGGLAWTSSYII